MKNHVKLKIIYRRKPNELFSFWFLSWALCRALAEISQGSRVTPISTTPGWPRPSPWPGNTTRNPLPYGPDTPFSFSFDRHFLKFGHRNPSLFLRWPRSRLNSFGTLDLKIFGNKALKSIVVYLKSPRRRREQK